MQGGIYFISCENGKVYVGSAKNLTVRWGEHLGLLRAQKHFNRNLQRAWNKYGSSSFVYSIQEVLGEYDKDVYFARENWWIDHLRAVDTKLFNIARAEGGWGPETFLRKTEIVDRISASVKRALADPVIKEKMSLAKRGKKLSDEHRRKTSHGLTGIKRSVETRAKMSKAQKARAPLLQAQMSEVGKRNIGRTPSNAVTFTIDGINYPSGKAAERSLGITSRQLANMVKNGTAQRS